MATRLQPPRWKDARLMLGVLIVLASVVAGSRVVASVGRTEQVWAVTDDLAAGTTLVRDDLRLVDVRLDALDTAYLSAVDADPVGRTLQRPVSAGELLPRGAVQNADPAAERRVTVPVERFHRPLALDRGQRVDVYVTPKADTAGSAGVRPPSLVLSDALVVALDAEGGHFGSAGDSAGVVLAVGPDQVQPLVEAVRSGVLDLVARGS